MADRYANFAALNEGEREGIDFDIVAVPRPGARTLIMAPHGGSIEIHTSSIARQIAGDCFSFYAFEGRAFGSFRSLHITSTNFDEPRALELARTHARIVTVHGCREAGMGVLLGGLDTALIAVLAAALRDAGIDCATAGHRFLAQSPANICNRGTNGAGAQIEVPMSMRTGAIADRIARATHDALQDAATCQSPSTSRC